MTLDDVQSLLDAPSPAVLTTYRKDRRTDHTGLVPLPRGRVRSGFAKGDVKRQHLAQTPSCLLVVFEAVPPFRGVELKGEPELVDGDVTNLREAIAGRYLGVERGRRFAATRRSPAAPCFASPRETCGSGISRPRFLTESVAPVACPSVAPMSMVARS